MMRIPETVEPAILPGKIVLNVATVGFSTEQFVRLCADNRDLRFELTAEKEIVIMPPEFSETALKSGEILNQILNWSKKSRTGVAFGSSAGFTLPNGAIRSPDASWIIRSRWDALTPAEKQSFAPLCPDFVMEFRSSSDTLKELQAKMEEYMANGARLGLLIDPIRRKVYVYRPGQRPARLDEPASVSCEPEMPGLAFQFSEIW